MRGHRLEKFKLAALGSFKMVLVVCVEPFVKIVARISKPNNDPNLKESPPYIAWAMGSGAARDPIMAIGWGRSIMLIRFENIEGGLTDGFKIISQFTCESSISYLNWFSPEIIAVVTTENCLQTYFAPDLLSSTGQPLLSSQ